MTGIIRRTATVILLAAIVSPAAGNGALAGDKLKIRAIGDISYGYLDCTKPEEFNYPPYRDRPGELNNAGGVCLSAGLKFYERYTAAFTVSYFPGAITPPSDLDEEPGDLTANQFSLLFAADLIRYRGASLYASIGGGSFTLPAPSIHGGNPRSGLSSLSFGGGIRYQFASWNIRKESLNLKVTADFRNFRSSYSSWDYDIIYNIHQFSMGIEIEFHAEIDRTPEPREDSI